MDETDHDAVARLRATAHPVRLRILSLLTAEAMSAAEVARALELTHANASYHLRQLHDVGELVVESEEKIRGGVAKRYRYDASRDVAPRQARPRRAHRLRPRHGGRDGATPPRRGAGHLHLQRPRGLGGRRDAGTGRSTCCTRPRTCCTPPPGRRAPRTPSTSAPRTHAFTMSGGLTGDAARWNPGQEGDR